MPLSATLLPVQDDDILEFEEQWSYVQYKAHKAWLWLTSVCALVLCRRSRQIIAYAISDRSEATCRWLWSWIPEAYRKLRSYSDFYQTYLSVLPAELHDGAGKETGQTLHIERFNNTLRHRDQARIYTK